MIVRHRWVRSAHVCWRPLLTMFDIFHRLESYMKPWLFIFSSGTFFIGVPTVATANAAVLAGGILGKTYGLLLGRQLFGQQQSAQRRSHGKREVTWTASIKKRPHNSPICDNYQSLPARVLTLPWKQAQQDDSSDNPQPTCEFQVRFP